MTGEPGPAEGKHAPFMSRRDFLIGMTATVLLTGCSTQQSTPAPTSTPASTPTAVAQSDTPDATPISTSTAVPTSVPTATALPTISARKPKVIQIYPDKPSRVVHTHHAGVWDGDALSPTAIRQMLDASITNLTGLNDAIEAWAALFDPGERIAIKVNAFRNSLIWTHVPLVTAVAECLQEAGIPPEQIVVYDYYTNELLDAGYQVNQDGPGIRCYGTDSNYSKGWQVVDVGVQLSDVLLSGDALINIPVLKMHSLAGLSFALKNHYGTIARPQNLHHGERLDLGLAELNALPPIRDRTRLVIGDVLTASLSTRVTYPYWDSDYIGDSILMSFDPIAHDTIGLQLLCDLLAADERNPAIAETLATPWLENGAKLGLGTNDLDSSELIEISL